MFFIRCTHAIDKSGGLRARACQSSCVTIPQTDPLVVPNPRTEDAGLAFAEPGQDGPEIPAQRLHRARVLAAVLRAPGLPRLEEAVLGHVVGGAHLTAFPDERADGAPEVFKLPN